MNSAIASIGTPTLWVAFALFVVVLLVCDLCIFHRNSRAISAKEALLWSVFWIAISLLFNLGIFLYCGREPALQFLTGYLIEKALSIDNLFLFLVIFSYFSVPRAQEYRVLFYGIIGAVIARAAFIFIGAALLSRFEWMMYVFGLLVLIAAARLCFHEEAEADISTNIVLRTVRKFFPTSSGYHGQNFLVRLDGKLFVTPLLLALLVIEATDIMFALDSIPAVFAITRDPFIVFTSNIFAVLGLRAFYFLVAAALKRLVYLHYGLAAVLAFIGAKILLGRVIEISTGASLAIIFSVIAVTVLLSRCAKSTEA